MKILVYGVGAIGSLLVHYLCKAGNDVTVAARSTYSQLKQNGLEIRHYLQRKTTVDHPKIVRQAEDTHYDIVFSVMQGNQQIALLPTLAVLDTNLKIPSIICGIALFLIETVVIIIAIQTNALDVPKWFVLFNPIGALPVLLIARKLKLKIGGAMGIGFALLVIVLIVAGMRH